MDSTLIGSFDSRRDAEIAVEHLVQEYGVDRSKISVKAAGEANSAGTRAAGADVESGHPGVVRHGSPELESTIEVVDDCHGLDRSIVEAAFKKAGAKRSR